MILDKIIKLINELENILKKDNRWKNNNDFTFRSKMKKIYKNDCEQNINSVFMPYIINNLKQLENKDKKYPDKKCPDKKSLDLTSLKLIVKSLLDEVDKGFDLDDLDFGSIDVDAIYYGSKKHENDPVVKDLGI